MAATDVQYTVAILQQLVNEARRLVNIFENTKATVTKQAAESGSNAEAAAAVKSEVERIRDLLEGHFNTFAIPHEWNGTALRLLQPDGTFGPGVDLRGTKGEKGDPGEPGLTGPPGQKGERGGGTLIRGVISSIGDLPSSAKEGDTYILDATGHGITWTGQIWFDVGPIRGPDGRQGLRGEKGEKGDRGDIGQTGPEGKQGIQGAQGIKGDRGDQGLKGDRGLTGDQGVPGRDGATWRAGSSLPADSLGVDSDLYFHNTTGDVYQRLSGAYGFIANVKGPKGDRGDQGIQGQTGAKGDKGDQGLKGDQGIQGNIGVKGDKGDTGSQGNPGADGATWRDGTGAPAASLGRDNDLYLDRSTGNVHRRASGAYTVIATITGPQGQQGVKGDQGFTGAKGDKGDTGSQGVKGDRGDIGLTGAKGDKGDTGAQGVPGPAAWASPLTWSAGTAYSATSPISVVSYAGSTFACTTSHISGASFDPAQWRLVAAKGDQGQQGPKGDTGLKGDTGATGGQGPRGDTGATGLQGQKGDKGDQGIQGPAGTVGTPSELEIRNDTSDPKLSFVGSNPGTWNRISGTGPLAFLPVGRDSTSNPVLFLQDGHVGINNPSPTVALDIYGDIKATGSILPGPSNGGIWQGVQKGPLRIDASTGSDDAVMSFHRPGMFGVNFGVGSDNQLRIGGWSMGEGASYLLWTEYNSPGQFSNGDPFFIRQKLPSGGIILLGSQGLGVDGGGTGYLAFPIAFPNKCRYAVGSIGDFNSNPANGVQFVDADNGGGIWVNVPGVRTPNAGIRLNYIAFGW